MFVVAAALVLWVLSVLPVGVLGTEGESDTATTSTSALSVLGSIVERGVSTQRTQDTVRITVRTEERVVAHATWDLPEEDAQDVRIEPTAGGTSVSVAAHSVLSTLSAFDTASDDFTIADLVYYESFGSLFLNCIDVPDRLCGSWQYTVNGEYPSVGMDKYVLKDQDEVFIFFGSPRLVSIPDEPIVTGEPFTVTAEQYDPSQGAYLPVSGYTIGIIQDNPDDPWVPIEVLTAPARSAGDATFTIATSGAYKVGIKEDFYTPAVPLTVVETRTSPSGGGGGIINTAAFDVRDAASFIADAQKADGSFGSALYTDWAAVALAATSYERSARDRVKVYLKDDMTLLSSATDYERRALALMALGIDPYRGTKRDLIAGILARFDGTQIGEVSLVNDDIFGLIVLERAGFDTEDDVIRKTIETVCKEQRTNGSWEGSIDLTAAAIQALVPHAREGCVQEALDKGTAYLKGVQGGRAEFGNVFATSWALQAIAAFGDTPREWSVNGETPLSYLASEQARDGGMLNEDADALTRLWATSYAIPGATGKPWHEILDGFTRPKDTVAKSGGTGTRFTATAPVSTPVPIAAESGGTLALTGSSVRRATIERETKPTSPTVERVYVAQTAPAPVQAAVTAALVAPAVAPRALSAESAGSVGALTTAAIGTTTATTTATTTHNELLDGASQVALASGAGTFLPLLLRILAGAFALGLIVFAFALLVRKQA